MFAPQPFSTALQAAILQDDMSEEQFTPTSDTRLEGGQLRPPENVAALQETGI